MFSEIVSDEKQIKIFITSLLSLLQLILNVLTSILFSSSSLLCVLLLSIISLHLSATSDL